MSLNPEVDYHHGRSQERILAERARADTGCPGYRLKKTDIERA
jgi:hypothetical protein